MLNGTQTGYQLEAAAFHSTISWTWHIQLGSLQVHIILIESHYLTSNVAFWVTSWNPQWPWATGNLKSLSRHGACHFKFNLLYSKKIAFGYVQSQWQLTAVVAKVLCWKPNKTAGIQLDDDDELGSIQVLSNSPSKIVRNHLWCRKKSVTSSWNKWQASQFSLLLHLTIFLSIRTDSKPPLQRRNVDLLKQNRKIKCKTLVADENHYQS